MGVIVIILLYIFDFAFSSIFSRDKYYKSSWVLNKKNESYDVAFLGNSRVYTQLSTDSLSKKLGKKCINIGVDGTNIMHHALLLELFFKQNNKIKYLVYNIDPWSLSFNLNEPKRTWILLNEINDSSVYSEYKSVFGYRTYLWRYFPFWKFTEYNSRLGLLAAVNSKLNLLEQEYNIKNGDYLKPNNMVVDTHKLNSMANISDNFKVNNQNLYFLEKMIALCKSKNVKLIMITAPILNIQQQITKKTDLITNKYLSPIFDKTQTPYLDFTHLDIGLAFHNFYDYHHLNNLGKTKYNSILAEELQKQFD